MAGRTVIITGASDGLGAVAADRLSRSGENVVVVGRSEAKTTAVAARLGVEYFVADFTDLAQVRRLAEQLLRSCTRIDVLANNAGRAMRRRELTVDGHRRLSRSITWPHFCSRHCCWIGSSNPAPRC